MAAADSNSPQDPAPSSRRVRRDQEAGPEFEAPRPSPYDRTAGPGPERPSPYEQSSGPSARRPSPYDPASLPGRPAVPAGPTGTSGPTAGRRDARRPAAETRGRARTTRPGFGKRVAETLDRRRNRRVLTFGQKTFGMVAVTGMVLTGAVVAAGASNAEVPLTRATYTAQARWTWSNDVPLGRTESSDQYAQAQVSGLRSRDHAAAFLLRYENRESKVRVAVSGTHWVISPAGGKELTGKFPHSSSGVFRAEIQGQKVRVFWNGKKITSQVISRTYPGKGVVATIWQSSRSVQMFNVQASSMGTTPTTPSTSTKPTTATSTTTSRSTTTSTSSKTSSTTTSTSTVVVVPVTPTSITPTPVTPTETSITSTQTSLPTTEPVTETTTSDVAPTSPTTSGPTITTSTTSEPVTTTTAPTTTSQTTASQTTTSPTTSTTTTAGSTTSPSTSTSTTTSTTPAPLPAGGGTWLSGAAGDNVMASGAFETWRRSNVGIAGVWDDTKAAQLEMYSICRGQYKSWNKALDLAMGGIYKSSGESWSAAASGAYDSRWRKVFTTMKGCWGSRDPGKLYIRFAHEMNLPNDWGVKSGQEGDFVKTFRRIADIRDQVFPGAKLVFSPNEGSGSGMGDVRLLWPGKNSQGKNYADVYGVDHYNRWSFVTTASQFQQKINVTRNGAPVGIEKHRQFAESLGAPFAAPEWNNPAYNADGGGGGESPVFMQEYNKWLRANAGDASNPQPGKVLYEVLFNMPWREFQLYATTQQPKTADAYRSLKWG